MAATVTVSLESLYSNYDTLSKTPKVDDALRAAAFEHFLSGCANEDCAVKRLSAQFISKFYLEFPDKLNSALECMFDLCEDGEMLIRREAVKCLTQMCKADTSKSIIAKVSDIFTQLLQVEDATERNGVISSLKEMLVLDEASCLKVMFEQIANAEEEVVLAALNFLDENLATLGLKDLSLMKTEAEKALEDCSPAAFNVLISLLHQLFPGLSGRQKLMKVLEKQAELDAKFDKGDLEALYRFLEISKHAMPIFSRNVSSDAFASYCFLQIFPHLGSFASANISKVYRCAAELLSHVSPKLSASDAEKFFLICFDTIVEDLPSPQNETTLEHEDVDYIRIECQIFILHKLTEIKSDFLPSRVASFKPKLQYLASLCQTYTKQLKLVVEKAATTKDEKKVQVEMYLKALTNILSMCRDLLMNPPRSKTAVALSFKETTRVAKRPSASNGSSAAAKLHKPEMQTYRPPTGKFSNKAGKFNE